MKPPAAQVTWDDKLGAVDWSKVWQARTLLASPRDTVTWLQIKHRNLYVAKHGGWTTNTCKARGCQHVENQEHLVSCHIINKQFWCVVMKYMQDLDMQPDNTPEYWILGLKEGKTIIRDEADIIAWAWRALYAETIRAHIDNKEVNFKRALCRMSQFALSRAKAYGRKWRRWWISQRLHRKPKDYPEEHSKHKLIRQDVDATYEIHPNLSAWVKHFRNL